MNRLHFLTLEFKTQDKLYWLASGVQDSKFCVVVTPFLFSDLVCAEDESDYAEIFVYEDRVELKKSHLSTPEIIEFNVADFQTLSWEEAFWELAEELPLKDLTRMWHDKIVRKKGDEAGIDYKVTAFLPEEGVFAVFGSDYKLPENPNWVTYKAEDEKQFLEFLSMFKIVAIGGGQDYHNA